MWMMSGLCLESRKKRKRLRRYFELKISVGSMRSYKCISPLLTAGIFLFRNCPKIIYISKLLKKLSIETPKTWAKPYNSISVTVRLPSSILEIDPRQMYMARVSNRSDNCCWLRFFSFRSIFTFSPIKFLRVPSMILAI